MYKQTKHARDISKLTFFKGLVYALMPPDLGAHEKIKRRFGSNSLLFLNTETALSELLRNLPKRQPGMVVALEYRHAKRLGKIIERVGLKPVYFSGQKQLASLLSDGQVPSVIILSDAYEFSSDRFRRTYNNADVIRVVYQHRKRPRATHMPHDVFIWEPRALPRALSGAVVAIDTESFPLMHKELLMAQKQKEFIRNEEVLRELWHALRGRENRFRRVDSKPGALVRRLVYDFCK